MVEQTGVIKYTLQAVPILPLRDIVVYPNMVIPLFVGRQNSIHALEAATAEKDRHRRVLLQVLEALEAADADKTKQVLLQALETANYEKDKQVLSQALEAISIEKDRQVLLQALEAVNADKGHVLLVLQKDPTEDTPQTEGLYQVGTLATVLQLLKLPDGTVKVLVEGTQRCELRQITTHAHYLSAIATPLETPETTMNQDIEVLIRTILSQFERYIKFNKKIPTEILSTLTDIDDPNRIADMVAMHLALRTQDKQGILEISPLKPRLEKLLLLLAKELNLLQAQKRVRNRIQKQVEKNQLNYYLQEKMKAIQKELDASQDVNPKQDQLETKITKARMPKEAKKKAMVELNKLKTMPAMSAEATVSRNYLESLLAVPWHQRSKLNYELQQAETALNKAHYGLDKVKERVTEFLAVHKRVRNSKGPILCLVGPPGVGKTSLGRAIATAIGRKFVRVSLGGVRDEAEIRGHRRTYIGAMPGQIMQKMTKAAVKNPLFMLDEIDKMAMDFRGDPASALLEVLDPEQNNTFNDHYLDVDYDLSEVLFIATANTLDIPAALLDRMEIIRIPGYIEDEKIHIAQHHLLSKQKAQNGLKTQELTVTLSALQSIIRHYTREAGVRHLERELAKLCRKTVMQLFRESKRKKILITPRNIEKYLGIKRFRHDLVEEEDQIGQVRGLAWTEVGEGELLRIEAAVLPGKGKMNYTGHLGEVMQESIQAAFTVVRSRGAYLGIDHDIYEKSDIHVHVPEGATPKDGPSAGIGMCTALVSSLTRNPVRADIAMTGEITLRGEVLPIGGLREKLLAARRGKIREVIIPEENQRDLKEIPKSITQELKIHPVRWIDQVLDLAFRTPPKPLQHPGENHILSDINLPSEQLLSPSMEKETHAT